MSTITKEQAQSVSDLKAGYTLGHADVTILNELARIALASLEAEPVPECFKRLLHHAYGMTMGHDWNKGTMAGHHRDKLCRAVEECRAAMIQGAERVTTAYKLPDDFDFDRFNDVTWLDAVASNPHMHSLTTSTIAMVALELNKRLEAGNSLVIGEGRIDEAI